MSYLMMENICKCRPLPEGREVAVLQDVSLQLPAERVTVLIGPSGCGKTTLLRLLNRLEEPTSGRILLRGEDIACSDPLQLRQRVALLPQKPFMFPGTVADNLRRPFVYRRQSAPACDHPRWRQALEYAGLPEDLLRHQAGQLSVGQQQRVALARCLLTEPEVLLLDEPTSALDRPTSDRLAGSIRELCRQRALPVLLVTHDLWLAERVADDLVFLAAGQVAEQGPAPALLQHPQTESLRRFLVQPVQSGVLP
jgi:putative ABC transport system ATP-binding protein